MGSFPLLWVLGDLVSQCIKLANSQYILEQAYLSISNVTLTILIMPQLWDYLSASQWVLLSYPEPSSPCFPRLLHGVAFNGTLASRFKTGIRGECEAAMSLCYNGSYSTSYGLLCNVGRPYTRMCRHTDKEQVGMEVDSWREI